MKMSPDIVPVSTGVSESLADMILIPAGPFVMGANGQGDFEGPAREVTLRAFRMDATPVTNAQFHRFINATGYRTRAEVAGSAWGHVGDDFRPVEGLNWHAATLPDRGDHPVTYIAWADALAFANWAGKRLPTEAEWEKAARGGRPGALYPWGDSTPDGSQSNFAQTPAFIPPTTPVKRFAPNEYGLYDMVGNVWQWCADWYQADYYAGGSRVNPTGPEQGQHRVRRGGSWNVIQTFRLRCANRGAVDPGMTVPNLGFRCVTDD
jgi:formylglycine-generating enzyme required for sulfatase activity